MIMVKEITRGVTMSWYGAARKTDLGPTLWGKVLNLLFVCDRLWLNENVFETIFKRISVFRSLRLLWSMLLIVWIERVDKRLERGHRWCMDTFCFLVFTCYYYLIVETVVETRLETVPSISDCVKLNGNINLWWGKGRLVQGNYTTRSCLTFIYVSFCSWIVEIRQIADKLESKKPNICRGQSGFKAILRDSDG